VFVAIVCFPLFFLLFFSSASAYYSSSSFLFFFFFFSHRRYRVVYDDGDEEEVSEGYLRTHKNVFLHPHVPTQAELEAQRQEELDRLAVASAKVAVSIAVSPRDAEALAMLAVGTAKKFKLDKSGRSRGSPCQDDDDRDRVRMDDGREAVCDDYGDDCGDDYGDFDEQAAATLLGPLGQVVRLEGRRRWAARLRWGGGWVDAGRFFTRKQALVALASARAAFVPLQLELLAAETAASAAANSAGGGSSSSESGGSGDGDSSADGAPVDEVLSASSALLSIGGGSGGSGGVPAWVRVLLESTERLEVQLWAVVWAARGSSHVSGYELVSTASEGGSGGGDGSGAGSVGTGILSGSRELLPQLDLPGPRDPWHPLVYVAAARCPRAFVESTRRQCDHHLA
jgi:hypothetical protein